MGPIQRVVKPANQRAKRALEDRAPKLIENDKKTIFVHGHKTSETGRNFISAMYGFKKVNSIQLKKCKDKPLPFDDLKLEFLSKKFDSSLFALCNHTKKRPDNIVMGRMYNHQIFDMFELGISNYKAFETASKISAGTKPCIIFSGVDWDQSKEFTRLKSLFLDFFRGTEVKNINLTGFELALQFTATKDSVLFKPYRIILKKSGGEIPRVELEEVGPSLTLKIRRTKLASDDLLKTACKKPKALKAITKKNLEKDALGNKLGRIHMERQDYGKLQVRKTAAIKKAKRENLIKKKQEKSIANHLNSAADE